MPRFPWRKRRTDRDLSAYLDGELGPEDMDRIGESIAFQASARERLDSYARLTELLEDAIAPPHIPDSSPFADELTERLMGAPAEDSAAAVAARTAVDSKSASSSLRRRLPSARTSATVLASIGILVTAGVTIAGLWRRGVV